MVKKPSPSKSTIPRKAGASTKSEEMRRADTANGENPGADSDEERAT